MIQVKTMIKLWVGVLLGLVLLAATATVRSAEENPESEALFQKGMDALQDDRLKSAIRAFSKILDTEPELDRARLELALAYYRSMRYENAEKLAQSVLDNPTTPAEVRVTVLAFLAQLRRDAEQFKKKNNFSSYATAGIMHDSNINVGPTTADIRIGDTPISLTQGSLKRSDNAGIYNIGVDHLYQTGKHVEVGETTGMLMWQSSASVYYRDYHKFNEFDLGVASLSTGPALLVLRHWRASLQVKTDFLTLNKEALGWFSSVNPSVTWQFNNGELNWDAIYTRRFYNRNVDDGRKGDYLATGMTLGRYFDQRRVSATAGGRLIKFLADDDQFGYTGFQVSAGVSTVTYRNGSAYVRQRFAYFDYDGKDTIGLKAREEKEYRSTFGLSHEYNEPGDLLKGWVANLLWER
ncbi:MAG TPA: hypothetical protein ENI74_04460, partial [Gammaproteobacteria bacterium]|nr:hypothetical protein [Gammaproteobacteria bacterium]